ncbi:exosome 3'-_5 exonuclease subunit ski4 (Csl4) [Neophaeococcomyces mojaviensis]|uniref:Exosome 3'->5 exonuclease subunit ski4 (Csl4) n=1 Tax=Neophaeococcomyces mojaviensis TaxID=3383035 RepID=A0ACC3AHT0_9EURO|nr:exosome 3'->5 exonuclease subunit ski4 (Csl4) [Knufia sp. JES_112]
MTSFATPGQVLGNLSAYLPGAGTHVTENTIHASLAGPIVTSPPATKSSKPTLSIVKSSASISDATLPEVGSVVLARVLRVQPRQLNSSILAVNPSLSTITSYTSATDDETQFQAVLRKEDVRAFEKDKVVMNEMFRVGDIVKAVVISLGDERNYYISTAGNDYGVIIARSQAGNPMVPTSWKEMRDTITGKAETRKVAKPA